MENKLGDAEREAVSRENKLLSRIQDLEKKLGNAESELQLHEDDYLFSSFHIPFIQLYDEDKDVPEELVEEGENVIKRDAEMESIEVPENRELLANYMSKLISEVSHLVSQPVANNELIEEVKVGISPEGNQPHIEETKVASVVPAEEIKEAAVHIEGSSTVTTKRHRGRRPGLGFQGNYSTEYKKSVLEYAYNYSAPLAIKHFHQLEPNKKELSKSTIYRWIRQLKKAQQNKVGSDPK